MLHLSRGALFPLVKANGSTVIENLCRRKKELTYPSRIKQERCNEMPFHLAKTESRQMKLARFRYGSFDSILKKPIEVM